MTEKYPESYDGSLDCVSYAVTCSFNRRGTLLAVGCNDGRIVIWDFGTRCIAKIIQAHTHPVCTLNWNRNGRKLLSGSTDNVACVWDVVSGECLNKFRFPALILKVQFNPRNDGQILICLLKQPPVLINLTVPHHITIPLDEEGVQDLNIVASFDRRGQHVYTGNAKGKVLIFDSHVKWESNSTAEELPAGGGDNNGDGNQTYGSLELKACFKTTSGGGTTTSGCAIKAIEFAKKGDNFLVCTADRVIRIYNADIALTCKPAPISSKSSTNKNSTEINEPLETTEFDIVELEPIQKLSDLVNRTQWKKCCFSGGRNSLPNLFPNPKSAKNTKNTSNKPNSKNDNSAMDIDGDAEMTCQTNGHNIVHNGVNDNAEKIGEDETDSMISESQYAFSRYVCAGSAKQHSIYIWDLSTSTLVKILHGTKGEILLDLDWHPSRGIIASVSSGTAMGVGGTVTLWSHGRSECWSAFAPNFTELDDNIEYVEKESEFDLTNEDEDIDTSDDYNNNRLSCNDEKDNSITSDMEVRKDGKLPGFKNGVYDEKDKARRQKKLHKKRNSKDSSKSNGPKADSDDSQSDENDIIVDVTTVKPDVMFLSSDEEINLKKGQDLDSQPDNDLLFIPTAPEIEDPEESLLLLHSTYVNDMVERIEKNVPANFMLEDEGEKEKPPPKKVENINKAMPTSDIPQTIPEKTSTVKPQQINTSSLPNTISDTIVTHIPTITNYSAIRMTNKLVSNNIYQTTNLTPSQSLNLQHLQNTSYLYNNFNNKNMSSFPNSVRMNSQNFNVNSQLLIGGNRTPSIATLNAPKNNLVFQQNHQSQTTNNVLPSVLLNRSTNNLVINNMNNNNTNNVLINKNSGYGIQNAPNSIYNNRNYSVLNNSTSTLNFNSQAAGIRLQTGGMSLTTGNLNNFNTNQSTTNPLIRKISNLAIVTPIVDIHPMVQTLKKGTITLPPTPSANGAGPLISQRPIGMISTNSSQFVPQSLSRLQQTTSSRPFMGYSSIPIRIPILKNVIIPQTSPYQAMMNLSTTSNPNSSNNMVGGLQTNNIVSNAGIMVTTPQAIVVPYVNENTGLMSISNPGFVPTTAENVTTLPPTLKFKAVNLSHQVSTQQSSQDKP